jgi:sporulation protein YlmC with PRC-barrel domain
MDIKLNVPVKCSGNAEAGHVTGIVVDPKTSEMTHIIVKIDHVERIVPASLILNASADLLKLDCTIDHLREQQPLIETDYVRSTVDHYDMLPIYTYVGINPPIPVATSPEMYPVEHENIPSGEQEIRHGLSVFARDGRVGRVDDVVIDPANGHITAVILREGHLWGAKEVTVAASHIKSIEDDGIYLKMTKDEVAQLQPASRNAMNPADHTMNISVHAAVHCTDGDFGHITCLIINPINKKITHFVVSEPSLLGIQHIVPVSFITATTNDSVTVNCDRATLGKQPDFIEYEYEPGDAGDSYYLPVMLTAYPDMYIPGPGYIPLEHEQIPLGELAVRRGMDVTAVTKSDEGDKTGRVSIGHVDSLVADPSTEKITHLTLREGHLWGKRDVTIPVNAIAKITPTEVQLKLTKDEVETLPSVPVKRLL